MTFVELQDYLEQREMSNTMLISPEITMPAVIGITAYGAIVYDNNKLIDCFAEHFATVDGNTFSELSDKEKGEYEQEASEYIEQQVNSCIYSNRPYENGDVPPIICEDFSWR